MLQKTEEEWIWNHIINFVKRNKRIAVLGLIFLPFNMLCWAALVFPNYWICIIPHPGKLASHIS